MRGSYTGFGVETDRIRAEYANRAQTIDPARYAWDRPEIQYWKDSTSRVLRGLLPSNLAGKAIADIGCGTGQWMEEFVRWGADPAKLHGIDLLPDRVAAAQGRMPQADIHCGDASSLLWPDASIDVVTQFTVFSSILDASMRSALAREMLRILKPGGHILWYDCRYSNPRRAVRGIGMQEIRNLFPNCSVRFETTTLFPPLSRLVARYSWKVAALLESLPFTRTHLAALITPR